MENVPIQVSPEEIMLVGAIIASLLEPVKLVPGLIQKFWGLDLKKELLSSLPTIAILIGIILSVLFLSNEGSSIKSILFEGSMYGFAAVGGRQAVMSTTKPWRKGKFDE